MKTIRQKLTTQTAATLMALVGFVLITFFYFGNQTMAQRLKDNRAHVEENLLEKGTLLVSNSAFLLRVYVEDNSISTVSDMVQRTVSENKDVVFGGYVRHEDYQPWVWVTPEDPAGQVQGETTQRNRTTEWAMSLSRPAHRVSERQCQRYF